MLKFDVASVMTDREITNPNRFLCKNGFTPHTASRLLNNRTKSISHHHMQKLCTLLHCTPNDLYTWQHAGTFVKDENQPMQFLTAVKTGPPVIHKLKHLSLQKFREKKKAMEDAIQSA